MTSSSNAVSWNDVPAPGALGNWSPTLRTTPQLPAVLRLFAAALGVLAGAFLVGSTFPALVSVTYGDRGAGDVRYQFSGWSTDWEGAAPREYDLVIGLPLVVAAGVLLVAAGLVAASEWLPRSRGPALVVTLAAVSYAVGQVWVGGSYVSDMIPDSSDPDSYLQAARGPGYWLLQAAVLSAVLFAACLVASQLVLHFRNRSGAGRTELTASSNDRSVAGQPQPYAESTSPSWPSAPSPWGGQ